MENLYYFFIHLDENIINYTKLQRKNTCKYVPNIKKNIQMIIRGQQL